jgi:hypothetical protein
MVNHVQRQPHTLRLICRASAHWRNAGWVARYEHMWVQASKHAGLAVFGRHATEECIKVAACFAKTFMPSMSPAVAQYTLDLSIVDQSKEQRRKAT